MSEYTTLRKHQNQLHPAPRKADIPSSNTHTTSSPVVQMIRKRVFHAADAFAANDIYYDKNDGKYYDHIHEDVKKNVDIPKDVCIKCNDLFTKYSHRTTILAEARLADTQTDTFIQYDKTLTAETDPVSVDALTFTAGNEMAHAPKAVRLYAEGNMDHALSLDETLNSQEAYQKFMTLSDSNTDSAESGTYSEALIKATEYDSVGKVEIRYQADSQIKSKLKATHKTKRTEISFDGNTGDMTHAPSGKSARQYDLIQATFFWIPSGTNQENFNNLKRFMLNKKSKLNAGGKIRIVLSNRNNTKRPEYNHYLDVANNLKSDRDLNTHYDINLNVLKCFFNDKFRYGNSECTYATKLQTLGLNPENKFEHTQTYSNTPVHADSDLVIEATPKPQSPQSPEHAESDS